MRVALIHYWLRSWRGGERVLRAIADAFPGADIYTHVVDRELAAERFAGHTVRTTFIAKLPFSLNAYPSYLPLMPMALEQLDLRDYDLVISSESGPAKGVILRPGAVHLCYCHSPMRYLWDQYHEYRESVGALRRIAMGPIFHYMRMWDQISANRVDAFAANSSFVASRIRSIYRREAEVIYPPVTVEDFCVGTGAGEFFLWVGELVPYKRPDLAVEAFAQSGKQLKVIGEGQMLKRLRKRAPRNIEFLGRQSFPIVREAYSKCRALIFPGIEDFGMVPIEVMASGRPVIAFGEGGASETVVDNVTGVLFSRQSVQSLAEAVERFERLEGHFNGAQIAHHAGQFSRAKFDARFRRFVDLHVTPQRDDSSTPGPDEMRTGFGGGRLARVDPF